jgi:hypothetical protein
MSDWKARRSACAARDKSQRKTRRVEAEGEGKMIDDKKSTDPGLSAAERKTLRSRKAKEAIADHEEAQRALHGNLERLREERLAREAAAGPMLYPTPELPDDTLLSDVEFPARIRTVLAAAGLKTVGEARETSDEILLSFQDLDKADVAHLRETLGLPSTDGVRPLGKKPAWFAEFSMKQFPALGKASLRAPAGYQ